MKTCTWVVKFAKDKKIGSVMLFANDFKEVVKKTKDINDIVSVARSQIFGEKNKEVFA